MAKDHETYRESVAAYSLGALDSPEIGAVEAHLRTCKACRADLEAYRHIHAGLLFAPPPQKPPSSLRRSLQRQLESRRPIPRGWQWSWNVGLAAAAFVILVGLGLGSIVQLRSLQRQQAELEGQNRANQTLVSMLAYPNTSAIRFDQNGISGSVLVDKDRGLLGLFVWHLAPSEPGQTYQVWLVDANGERTGAGFLAPEAGYAFVTAVIEVPTPLANFKSIGVTVEPVGGSPAPTGPRVFGVDF